MKKIFFGFLLSILFSLNVNAAPCPTAGSFNQSALAPSSGFQGRLVGYAANNRGCDGDTAIYFSSAQVKSAADLANVDNTSDANKPISTATQTALNAKLSSTLNQNQIFVGDGSNIASGVAVSGDLTNSAGAFTIANNAVTNGKIRQSSGLSVIGRSSNSAGNVNDIGSPNDHSILRQAGNIIGFGDIDLSSPFAVGSSILSNSNTTATSSNTASTIVARDGSGNFNAGTITATNFIGTNSLTTPTIYGGSADASTLVLRSTSSATPSTDFISFYTNNTLRAVINHNGEATFGVDVVTPAFVATGTSSGSISILPQANSGTYNLNLPTSAGSSGQVLTSQGGGSTAMTWSDAEVPLTFGTGLTRTLNTVTVNTSQNIAKLSNLTSNGFVKTSGGDGTLSIDTNTYLTTISGISAGGDLSGTYPNPTVAKINGAALGTTTATAGNILIGSGTQWASLAASGDVTINSSGVTAIGASKVTNSMLAGSITASKLVGTDIGTVGTITSGTWAANLISVNEGGTGQNSATWLQGDIPYLSADGVWNHLAKNTNATRYLSNTGTSNNPAWAQIDLTNGVTGILPNSNTTATSANTASAIVARDDSGNFSGGTFTGNLNGSVSVASETSDTTSFLAILTDSATSPLPIKVNSNIRYNASTNLLSTNLNVIDNGGAALSTAISPLAFAQSLGAGSYISYGNTQFPRSTGVSSTGSLYHARNAFYNPVISNFSYGVSGGGVTLLDLSDTAINLNYAPSGTAGNPVTFTTGFSMSQSTGITTMRGTNIDNGGAALTGTNTPLTFGGALARGNYINFGTSGRNAGVINGGNFFLSANLDYNSTSSAYIYNSTNAASAIELGITGGALKYVVSGTAGTAATTLDALNWSVAGAVSIPNGDLSVSRNNSGGTVSSTISNTSNTASSNARILLSVAGATANDPFINFNVSGVTDFVAGIDNSDSDAFVISGSNTIGTNNAVRIDATTRDVGIATGNLAIQTVGKGLQIKTGANGRIGAATLVGGTVTVANTSVTANTEVFYSRITAGGVLGNTCTSTKSVGVNFTITCSSGLDTSTFNWMLVEAN